MEGIPCVYRTRLRESRWWDQSRISPWEPTPPRMLTPSLASPPRSAGYHTPDRWPTAVLRGGLQDHTTPGAPPCGRPFGSLATTRKTLPRGCTGWIRWKLPVGGSTGTIRIHFPQIRGSAPARHSTGSCPATWPAPVPGGILRWSRLLRAAGGCRISGSQGGHAAAYPAHTDLPGHGGNRRVKLAAPHGLRRPRNRRV